jgi:putative transposase
MATPLRYVWTWPGIDPACLDPTSVTVAKDPAGRWFVTFHVDVPDPAPLASAGQNAGVDVGLKDFAVLSTGEKIPHPKDWERYEKRLKRYQRRLARCQSGSRNRAKARVKVARAHARVADARRDFLRRMLEYKARRYGRTVAVVDRWYPSSKTCSACGHLLDSLGLGTRHWTCPSCGARHDRDINAAKNILAAGLAVTACGGDVRRTGASSALLPVKQESQPAREGIPAV